MTITTNKYGTTIITAENGKALKRKEDTETLKSTLTSVSIGEGDSPDNWEECDYEMPTVKYSKLKIYAAVSNLETNSPNNWTTLQTWLENKTINNMNGWMAFSLAQEITNSHPLFESLYSEALEVLGLTREQGDAILEQCILDETSN